MKLHLSKYSKHNHQMKENNVVFDWAFKTDWFTSDDNIYALFLKKYLDDVYLYLCIQLSRRPLLAKKSLKMIVTHCKLTDAISKEVSQFKSAIVTCKQFNHRVDLIKKLNSAKRQIHSFFEVSNNIQ